ncbi:MAG: sugar phosphate isomerase/epimerase [Rhodobacteraceae bacterium]|nr:sugar phosphate isomerase/epimerase [Paracoccaceae bacterium]
MKFSLCNEVLAGVGLAEQCRMAAAMGYAGLEIAPYTLAPDPTRMTNRQVAEARAIVADHGLEVTGLHWLLIAPEGLSITDPDPAMRACVSDALAALVDLCAGLGGRVLVHGSPKQRRLGPDPERARAVALEHWAAAGARARAAGMVYCIEPISADEADFITTLAEGAALLDAVAEPGLQLMIDTGHALRGEAEPLADLAARWLPTGRIAHVQLNDSNRRGPGQGADRMAPFLAALRAAHWPHPVAVEPFVYVPDGATTAAASLGYLRGVLEGLEGAATG